MSRLGQQDVGHEGVITGRDGFSLRSPTARCRVSGQHDVGHEGVITGCDALSLCSPDADPQGVAQSPLQSTNIQSISFGGELLYYF
jgi:hypothetical protein